MSNILKIILFLLIVWCLLAQIFFIAIPLGILYLLKNDGYELILIAILVDGYYQAFYSVPILSIVTLISVILVNIIKPYLLMYTGDNEVIS